MKPHKLPYEEFRYIYGKVPRLCIDLVFKSEKGILLAQRNINPGKGLWHFPGGTILLGESIENSIKRISDEEIGFSICNYRLIGTIEFLPESNPFYHSVSIVYMVESETEKFIPTWHNKDIKYFKHLPDNMVIEHKRFILENDLL